jgi:hypothetical protein
LVTRPYFKYQSLPWLITQFVGDVWGNFKERTDDEYCIH